MKFHQKKKKKDLVKPEDVEPLQIIVKFQMATESRVIAKGCNTYSTLKST